MRTKPARYAFTSRWVIDADPARCWGEIERMLRPGAVTGWPGVRVVQAPRAVRAGESIRLAVRSPLGYRLRVDLALGEVDAPRVLAARSAGDLRGEGRVELHPRGAATEVRFTWNVETTLVWMNRAAPVLRPVFAAAHAVVMRAGERAMRRALRRRRFGAPKY